MGLTTASLRLILRAYKERPFSNVLTLGRQDINISADEVLNCFRNEGVSFSDASDATKSFESHETLWSGSNILDERYFFRLLGVQNVKSIDFTDAEKAEFVHDLNKPVDKNLYEKFDLIIDGGTVEHIFDVRQVFQNIGMMLAPEGRIIHISPVNNWSQHGFYQFSPTLFFDYYGENGFANMKGFLCETDIFSPNGRWNLYEIGAENIDQITSKKSLVLFFETQKTKTSTVDKIPIQRFYREKVSELGKPLTHSIKERIKKILPAGLKNRLVMIMPFLSQSRLMKPWGLRKKGAL